MQRHFEVELKNLKDQILRMGGDVESAVKFATQSLMEKKPELLKRVNELEDRINQEHKEVDEACVQLLARQSPLAADLRFVIAILKISTDLERMGDQAVNIGYNTKEYLEKKSLGPIPVVVSMAEDVQKMIRSALDAFVNNDKDQAKLVLEQDDIVDEGKDRVFHDLIKHIQSNPADAEQALNLILIARNLERLGDHATNIAEDVIFAVTGRDIRHGGA